MRRTWLSGAAFWPVGAVFAPEDGSGAGGGEGSGSADASGAASGAAAGGEQPAADASSILFPDENKDKGGEKPAEGAGKDGAKEGEKEGEKSTEKPTWKPYENDPNKSPEENEKAKAAHDLTNPDHPDNKVPEDGKYDFKMPEGIELDAKLAEAMSPVLKDIGLTQGQAQALAGALAKHRAEEVAKGAKEWSDMQASWVKDAMKDEEMGGDKWTKTVEEAQSAIARFGTPGLKNFLNTSGGGNHTEVIRFMSRVGRAMSDDIPDAGGSNGGKPIEAAHLLFPNDKPKG